MSPSSSSPPPDLAEALAAHGQEHLLRFWGDVDEAGRTRLEGELRTLDLALVDELVATLVREGEPPAPPADRMRPPAVTVQADLSQADRARAAARGNEALAAGHVAVAVVAGGQGTRLGFDGPKGTYPIGPVTDRTLFQLHAEKVRAIGRRAGVVVPFYVMTSPGTHEDTAAFFAAHDDFGLEHVRLFVQGTMPAVDHATGRILLAAPDRLALSPDGHGGVVAALAAPGPDGASSPLEEMRARGVTTLFYFQVDNPLTRIADPVYLGLHLASGADVSTKVVAKEEPGEKVGLVADVDGRQLVVEYTELDDGLAGRRDPDGRLTFRAGSIAIHVFERAFLERLAGGGASLPFHRALKTVSHVGDDAEEVQPVEPNAVKFERFIFDALPAAERALLVETDRPGEFEPLKNASGPQSPDTVRAALSELGAAWLEEAGATVRRGPDGAVPFGVEISPLTALDPDELRRRIEPSLVVDRDFVA